MKYAVEVGSDATIYVPNFIKIGSGIEKLIGRGNAQTHISYAYFYFFQNKESRLKMVRKLYGMLT
jgi:hypothetical protein